MQKKLIAAAVAGLIAVPALAQTNVSISGRFAGGYEQYKLSGGPAATIGHDKESRVSDQSSRVIINVSEDLGGGLKAWAQVDSRFATDLGGGTLGSGNTGMGFSGGWGKFSIGRWDLHYVEFGAIEGYRASSLQQFANMGIMSQVASNTSRLGATAGAGTKTIGRAEVLSTMASGSRTPNVLMWDSPNWNGFTARLAYTTSYAGTEGGTNRAVGDAGSGSAWNGVIRYKNGPWTGGLSYWNANGESGVAAVQDSSQRSTRAWVGYTFPMGLKVGLGWDRSKFDNSINGAANAVGAGSASRTAWMIPVSYSFGPHALYATHARAGSASGSAIAANTGGDYKATMWTLGYDYAFSKRTSAGVFYSKLNNNINAAGTVGGAYDLLGIAASGATATRMGEDARQWYIGMAHNF